MGLPSGMTSFTKIVTTSIWHQPKHAGGLGGLGWVQVEEPGLVSFTRLCTSGGKENSNWPVSDTWSPCRWRCHLTGW